jgi:3-hydroxy-D-aspartate aldolase
MPQLPPAAIGMAMSEIDTPALIIDLNAFERNLQRMVDLTAATGIRLRPHAKTHKSPIIGRKQIALGAVGVCCQKVSEAEVMVEGGVTDVFISNEVTGQRKLDRLAALARHASIMVATDNADNIAELARAARRAGVRLRVMVEIDVGANRCGVAPGPSAVQLALQIAAEPSLEFAGIQAYHGRAQHFRTSAERAAAITDAIAMTRQTVHLLREAGLDCQVVGGAGTGTFELEAASGVYNEIQPGSYCFMDADYARNRSHNGGPFQTFEHALFVFATVMSTPVPERAIVDAGHKALANDSGMPSIVAMPGALYERPSDEHGSLNVAACNLRPKLGDKVLLIPGHCDPTVNLHDWYVGVRGMGQASARVECVWPVAARGALF